ncbi:hypothetical protein FNF27_08071 [Cafeteria roenbergensis]|uniref:Pre-mRNA-splicing factor 18 n=2 Tax=Cafeteria roenbergensis TaxID=33653 RepID=A0A5A8D9V2_CAFRO|nr:hypothetical protein FNF31_06833 [Cafeteria roenbergensis]KAA0156852.1 hypothetical protein FNF29_00962 [Cafeteria roenbergensis]KAA0162362.1 hypothetical protein FNF27_08071 [Cafeteria roenbergensis]KAA0167554.1 hypothetical protein FNF28_02768 [Cafeteria roenbergensis]|eukprot:KAA0156852.1 hypothetical protein FNF29_00962 [Cafeteria roenbergensis]
MRLHAEDYKAAPAELVYQFYKRLLKEWELQLADRTRAEASSADGQAATRLFEQTAGFMKPLLDKCKYNVLDETILGHVLQMVLLQLERRYRDAGSHYMSLSIGHAPWPVGVGSFGIHERASRTKIRADNISHIMNDEEQRKFITSLKAMMTFCQKQYPPELTSNMVR